MTASALKALVALLPVSILLSGSLLLFSKQRRVSSTLQLLGAVCLIVVALAHICEGLNLFPGMHWGMEHSAGHYLDLVSAVLGLALFRTGYLLHALAKP